jgi:hypothetical protein
MSEHQKHPPYCLHERDWARAEARIDSIDCRVIELAKQFAVTSVGIDNLKAEIMALQLQVKDLKDTLSGKNIMASISWMIQFAISALTLYLIIFTGRLNF